MKRTIGIHPTDKHYNKLNEIFDSVKKYGRYDISNPEKPNLQRGLARSIGIKYKTLIDDGFLNPPTITHNRYPSTSVFSLPTPHPIKNPFDIKIKKRIIGKTIWYDFKRIKIF